eukprot:5176874-Amphidinium_carterae.1
MVEGTPQGGPMSPWFFLMGLDPLLRLLSSHQRPLDLLSAWADDLAAVSIDFRSLCLVYDSIARFTVVSGLALQLSKCVFIPLGASSIEEWTVALYDWLPAGHGLREIPVRLTARYLGIMVGRGLELDLGVDAHDKLRTRGALVADLGLGSLRASDSTRLLVLHAYAVLLAVPFRVQRCVHCGIRSTLATSRLPVPLVTLASGPAKHT